MNGDSAGVRPGSPYRLATRADAQAWRVVPWVVVLPLAAVIVYLLVSRPLTGTTIVPAVGVALAIAVVCLPAVAALEPEARSWVRRTVVIGPDGLTVDRPGKETFFVPWSGIARISTHSQTLGPRIPPSVQLFTDFYGPDRRRIPELTVHQSGYRYAVRAADVNVDGPAFLRALQDTPLAAALDLASRALVRLVHGTAEGEDDCLSARTVRELRRGRLWHARRSAVADERRAERVPSALVRIDLVLGQHAVETARRALEERPGDPSVRYHLAHALLGGIGTSQTAGPHALEHRAEVRDEARTLLEGLADAPAFAADAARDIAALYPEAPR